MYFKLFRACTIQCVAKIFFQIEKILANEQKKLSKIIFLSIHYNFPKKLYLTLTLM